MTEVGLALSSTEGLSGLKQALSWKDFDIESFVKTSRTDMIHRNVDCILKNCEVHRPLS